VPPEDVAVEIGQSASFHCAAVGIPTPTVEWFLGTTKISEGSTLIVEDVSQARGGSTYVCLVSSEAGRVDALAKLIVFGKLIYTIYWCAHLSLIIIMSYHMIQIS
jgi:hypothetical protein